MQTKIEPAAPTDVPALVELMDEFYAESSYTLDRGWAIASFGTVLGDGARGAVWIARRGAEVAGYAVLTLRHSMEFGALTGVIDDIFVRERFRRLGIASALLSAVFDSCRALHAAAVQVEVSPSNIGALALYQAFGLRPHVAERQSLTVQLNVPEHAV